MILDKQVCNPFSHLQDTVEHCQASRLRFFQKAWSNITSDQWIFESILGVKIEFVTKPVQLNPPSELKVSSSEGSIVNAEINKLFSTKRGYRTVLPRSRAVYIKNLSSSQKRWDFLGYFESKRSKQICCIPSF